MAELVTGYSGTPHISSDEVGRLLAGTVGSGRYVLETGNQLAATLEDANTLTIATGDALFDGRHVTVSTPETVTIDSGAQGVNRNDIVGIRYLKDAATSVETAELYVYKGTATSGTATDPEYPTTTILDGASEAFMPLYRIQLTGITVATPVKLFDTVSTYSDYLISLSETRTDVNDIWTPVSTATASGVQRFTRFGNLALLRIQCSGNFAANKNIVIGTLKPDIKPVTLYYGDSTAGQVWITGSGEINIIPSSSTTSLGLSIVYALS